MSLIYIPYTSYADAMAWNDKKFYYEVELMGYRPEFIRNNFICISEDQLNNKLLKLILS